MTETPMQGSSGSIAQQAQRLTAGVTDKIFAAAQPGSVFSQPVVVGSTTIITASEVVATGGAGFGGEPQQGGGGGGSGGFSMGRPVAAIIISADGEVKVQPVVDATKIAHAGIAAWGTLLLLLARWARASMR
jgi:uncharacterized spore protein YtfJ